MNKSLFVLWIATAVCILSGAAPAQAELKVAVIDIQRIIDSSEAGKNAKEVLGEAFKTRQAELEEQKNAIEKLKSELEQQALLLSDEAKKQKEEQFEAMKKQFLDKLKQSEMELQQKDSELTQGVLQDLESVVLKIGEEEGYDLMLERGESNILFASDSINITDRVIARYNEYIKKPKVPAGEAKP